MKEKILETISNNQAYQNIKSSSNEANLNTNSISPCLAEPETTGLIEENPNSFKNKILKAITSNRSFVDVITDFYNDKDEVFIFSSGEKQLMSLDGYIITAMRG